MKKLPVNIIVLWIFFFVFFTSPVQSEEKGQIIQHPGLTELVYFGEQVREPPLAPLQKVRVNNKFFYVYPGVVIPSIQSVFLLENTTIRSGETVLDIGSGSGVQAIFAADQASKIVATDLSADAVENTLFNVKGHNLTEKIETRQGDLFGPIKKTEKFDVIIFNIDYPFDLETQGLWKVHERFFREVQDYLNPGGRIYYQAGLIANIPKIFSMVTNNKMRIMKMNMYTALRYNREPVFMLIIPDPLQPDIPM